MLNASIQELSALRHLVLKFARQMPQVVGAVGNQEVFFSEYRWCICMLFY